MVMSEFEDMPQIDREHRHYDDLKLMFEFGRYRIFSPPFIKYYQLLRFTHFILCQTPSVIREKYGDVSWSGIDSFPWNDPTAAENVFLAAQHCSVQTIQYIHLKVEDRWQPGNYNKYLWNVCQDETL